MRYVVLILVHLLLIDNPHLQIYLVVPSSAGYQVYRCVRPSPDCIGSSWSQCDEHVQQVLASSSQSGGQPSGTFSRSDRELRRMFIGFSLV